MQFKGLNVENMFVPSEEVDNEEVKRVLKLLQNGKRSIIDD